MLHDTGSLHGIYHRGLLYNTHSPIQMLIENVKKKKEKKRIGLIIGADWKCKEEEREKKNRTHYRSGPIGPTQTSSIVWNDQLSCRFVSETNVLSEILEYWKLR